MTKNSKILEDFQKEIEEMNEDDTRLKVIKELDTILGLIKSKKEKKRKEKILVSEIIPNRVWKA